MPYATFRSRPIQTLFLILTSTVIMGWLSLIVIIYAKTPSQSALSQPLPHYLKNAKQNLAYFQDEKTGICFAFMSASDSTSVIGGLATVDCEKVPPDLLK